MDKAEALHAFWSGFGLKAYNELTVQRGEDRPPYPYITYEVMTDSIDNTLFLTGALWYRTTVWDEIRKKAEEIAEYIRTMRSPLSLSTGGYLWIKKGTPFTREEPDGADDSVIKLIINIQVEFLTDF